MMAKIYIAVLQVTTPFSLVRRYRHLWEIHCFLLQDWRVCQPVSQLEAGQILSLASCSISQLLLREQCTPEVSMATWNAFPAFGYCHEHEPHVGNPLHREMPDQPIRALHLLLWSKGPQHIHVATRVKWVWNRQRTMSGSFQLRQPCRTGLKAVSFVSTASDRLWPFLLDHNRWDQVGPHIPGPQLSTMSVAKF